MKHTKEIHCHDLSLKEKNGSFQTITSSESIGFFVVFNKKEGHDQHNYVNYVVFHQVPHACRRLMAFILCHLLPT